MDIQREENCMDEFVNYAELQAEKAEKLSFCRGIKLLHIRDKVETMLGFIGKGGIFEEYTVMDEAWAPPKCVIDKIRGKGSIYYKGEMRYFLD